MISNDLEKKLLITNSYHRAYRDSIKQDNKYNIFIDITFI